MSAVFPRFAPLGQSFTRSPRHVKGIKDDWSAEWVGLDVSHVEFDWMTHTLEDPTPPAPYTDLYPKDYYNYFAYKTSGIDFEAAIDYANSKGLSDAGASGEAFYPVPGYDTAQTVPSGLRLVWDPIAETSSDPGIPTSVSISSLTRWWESSWPIAGFEPSVVTKSDLYSPQLAAFAQPFSLYGCNPDNLARTGWWWRDAFRSHSISFAVRRWIKFNRRVKGLLIEADWVACPDVFVPGISTNAVGWNTFETEPGWWTEENSPQPEFEGFRKDGHFAQATDFFCKNFRIVDHVSILADDWYPIPIPEYFPSPGSLADGFLGKISFLVIGETPSTWSARTGVVLS